MNNEINASDVLKQGKFWGLFIIGIGIAFMLVAALWSVYRILSGNDPGWNTISIETGNFISFLAIILSAYKAYNMVYNDLMEEQKRANYN